MPQVTRIKTGGRKPGTPNKTTAEVRQLAMTKAAEAIDLIADLMKNSQNDAVRLQAAKELLDRCCGKSADAIEVRRFENAESLKGRPPQTLDEILKEVGC